MPSTRIIMKYFLLLLLCTLTCRVVAQKTDKKLTTQLSDVLKGYHGQAGIFVQSLKNSKTAAINADSIFPTASMVKVSILCGVMDKIEKGQLQYNQKLTYCDSLLYKGEDILGSFKDGDTIQLSKATLLMITMSDNTASLWLQRLVGGDYINSWLEQNGFKVYRVNSRVPGREAYRKQYGWGMSTPYEMCRIFTLINDSKAVSEAASERMQRTLNRIYWDDRSLSQIPPYVQTLSKSGSLDDAKSETVLVHAPHGDYVFCVMTKNIKDQRWKPDNETEVLIRNISALLWHHFEPKSKWKPAAGMGKFMRNE